jgi:hypothetical protein
MVHFCAMKLAFAGYVVDVELEHAEATTSAHTGNPLRRGKIEIRARGDAPIEALKQLQNDSILTEPEGGNEWRIVRRDFTRSSSDSPVQTFAFTVEQAENRTADLIEFAGLALRPERYQEDARDGALQVKARIAVQGQEEHEKVRRVLLGDPVELIRRGVSERPRTMNVEVLVWSKDKESDEAVFDLIFDEVHEATPRVPMPGPLGELYPIRAAAAYAVEGVRELVSVLKSKQIVSEDEASRLSEAIIEKAGDRELHFRRREDVRAIPFSRDDER